MARGNGDEGIQPPPPPIHGNGDEGIQPPPPPTHGNGDEGIQPPPPPIEKQREMFFPARPLKFHVLYLGLAFGIAAAVFMLLSMIIALAVNPTGMKLFEDIFPGFRLEQSFGAVLIGLLWSFVTGFVIGTVTGLLYNWRLKRYVIRT
ncbi:MAG: hypothetical protein ACE5IW_03975 [bacterium]